jgi:NAD(P)-dependent dehydrogenase (short-subunit alcohol dehydrogenase family)
MRLGDRVVVVTGSTGIAAAGATTAAARGARVFIIGVDRASCAELVGTITAGGGDCSAAVADLTHESEAEAAFSACLREYGTIDGLFAVAGASGRRFGDGPLHDIPLAGWDATFRVNGVPAFVAAREAIRAMRSAGRGGSVVLVSSVLAAHPSPRLFPTHAYAAVKGAANAFVKTTASYYAPDRIRVNAIAPGLVATPMAQRAASDPETISFARRKQPLVGGFLDAGDVANAAVFLLSDLARAITGQVIEVDGGWGVTEVSP